MIFIDRSLSRRAAEALNLVRGDVEWLEPRFPHDTPDEDWLERAGAEQWLVVSKDKRLRTRTENWRAIQRHGVGCFIFTHNRGLPRWDTLKLLAQHLDEMEAKFASTPRPFIFGIGTEGRFRRMDQFAE